MTSKDLLSNLASYGIGRQDYILNPLGFISLLGSEILQKRSALAATPDAALRMKSLAKGMADLHGAIDAARVPLRFWVGLQSFNSLRNQEYLSAHRDEQLAKRIQTMMFAAFNPFEVISYVKNVAPSLLPFISAEQGGTCGRAACSLWFLSSLIEFYVLYRAYKRWKKAGGWDKQERNRIIMLTVVNICNTALSLNWSLQKGPLNNMQVAKLGTVSGLIGLFRSWDD